MYKVLIINFYTWYNKGDAAIATGTFNIIRHHIPDSEITLLSSTPENDQKIFERYNVKVLPNLFTPSPASKTSPSKYGLFKNAVTYVFQMAWFSLWAKTKFNIRSSAKETLDAYSQADLVLSIGGGYIGGMSLRKSLGSLIPLSRVFFAGLLHKK